MVKRDPRSDEELLEAFRQCILHAAKQENIVPRMVSIRIFRKYSPQFGVSTKLLATHIDNFGVLKDREFPPEINPLASPELKDCRAEKLADHVAKVIGDCSTELSLPVHEITWFEFARYINLRYGENSAGITKYAISKAGGFGAIKDKYFPPNPTPNTIDKRQIQLSARKNRKSRDYYSDHHFILERVIEDYAGKIFSGASTPVSHCCSALKTETKTILSLVLSDLHIATDVDEEETGVLPFGKTEEARRLASVILQTCNYKISDRSGTELEVLIIGDALAGILHDQSDGADIAEQIARCTFLLNQAIRYLSVNFPVVRVRVVTGNHDRLKQRHPKRAVQKKYDSFLTMIGYFLKLAFENTENVSVYLVKTPYFVYEVFGRKIFATHGDTVFNAGNPHKTINVANVEAQMNRLNAALKDSDEYAVFVMGHIHLGLVGYLSNGSTWITNGPLIPIDPFHLSIGCMEVACGQQLIESTPERAVASTTFLSVSVKDDRNPDLDAVIKPWVDF